MGVLYKPEVTMHLSPDRVGQASRRAKPGPEGPSRSIRQARVLIADGDSDICSVLSRLVERSGHSPSCASDGQEALESLRRDGADLIISDLEMPRMGGMRLLVESKSASPRTKFILMSAGLSNEDAARAFDLGADGIMQKPFSNALMAELIQGLLKNGSGAQAPALEKKALRVLVVDDEDMTLRLNEVMMKRMGHEVLTAEDGRAALEAFKGGAFDLVLTDRQMPYMGGLELLIEIRKLDARVPVIVASGNVSEQQEIHLYEEGANFVLRKPFTYEELKAAMKGCLP